MEAGEYGLTRGLCSIEHRPEVVAVAGLLWLCGLFWVRLDFVFFFPVFFFERTRPSARIRPPCLIYLATSNDNKAAFCLYDKKPSLYRGANRVAIFNLSVCLSACTCNTRDFY